jgi:hypothetical protein
MNLDLTSQEMEVLLSITAENARHGEQAEALWRKVSKEFNRKFDAVREVEELRKSHQLTGGK